MWAFLKNIFAGGVTSVINAGKDVYTAVEGDQGARDQQLSIEQVEMIRSYAAEFVARQQRTWFDSFADGLNRLVRPALALGAQGAFFWAAYDPVTFAETMKVLGIVPEPLWVIWAGIWGFYFTGRILEKVPHKWKIEPKAMEIAKEVAADRAARRIQVVPQSPPATAEPPPIPGTFVFPEDATPAEEPSVFAGKVDNGKEPLRAMAATLWGEARGEPYEGKLAVAWVIINRTKQPGWWGSDVVSVCTARWQFSCWWDVQKEKVRWVDERNDKFRECLAVAKEVLANRTEDPTGGADHYYAPAGMPGGAQPKWAVGHTPTTRIGGHVFYRLGLVA